MLYRLGGRGSGFVGLRPYLDPKYLNGANQPEDPTSQIVRNGTSSAREIIIMLAIRQCVVGVVLKED